MEPDKYRRFTRNGVEMEELIYEQSKTLAWVMYPYHKMILDSGERNPLYYVKNYASEESARAEVAELFDKKQGVMK